MTVLATSEDVREMIGRFSFQFLTIPDTDDVARLCIDLCDVLSPALSVDHATLWRPLAWMRTIGYPFEVVWAIIERVLVLMVDVLIAVGVIQPRRRHAER